MGRFCRRFRRFRRPPSLPRAVPPEQICRPRVRWCARPANAGRPRPSSKSVHARQQVVPFGAEPCAATRPAQPLSSDSTGPTSRTRRRHLVRRRLDCCRVGAKPCAAAARRARPWCSDDSAAAATLGERLDWRSPCRATRRPRASAGSLASGMSRGLPRRGGTDCVEGRANLVPGQQTCGSKPASSCAGSVCSTTSRAE